MRTLIGGLLRWGQGPRWACKWRGEASQLQEYAKAVRMISRQENVLFERPSLLLPSNSISLFPLLPLFPLLAVFSFLAFFSRPFFLSILMIFLFLFVFISRPVYLSFLFSLPLFLLLSSLSSSSLCFLPVSLFLSISRSLSFVLVTGLGWFLGPGSRSAWSSGTRCSAPGGRRRRPSHDARDLKKKRTRASYKYFF